MIRTFFAFCFFINTFCIYSQDNFNNKAKDIALRYMSAYGNWDFDSMKTFYAEDVYFKDPTGSEKFNQKFEYVGKENVYQFFKGIFNNAFSDGKPPYVSFKIGNVFSTGTFVIVNSTFECILPNRWFRDSNNEKIFISIPFLTILQIKNNKIISHTDYGDYDTYNKQIEAQIKHN